LNIYFVNKCTFTKLLIKFLINFCSGNSSTMSNKWLGIGTRMLDPITRVLDYSKNGWKTRVPGYSILGGGFTTREKPKQILWYLIWPCSLIPVVAVVAQTFQFNCILPWVDFTNIFSRLFCEQNENPFLAHSIWQTSKKNLQMETRFSKFWHSLG